MFYFTIIDDLGQRLLNSLQAALELVFGNSVKPLFDDFFANIVPFLLEAIWSTIVTAWNMTLYNLFIMLLFILDMIAHTFDIFTGMQDIVVDTATGRRDALFNIFFNHSGISRAFWGITIIACALCIAFTIFAVIRSIADLDGRRSVGKVLGLMGKSMLTFLLIPFMCLAGLNLASTVLNASASVISGQRVENKVSIGTQIFTAVSQDAMRHHPITPEEAGMELFLKFVHDGGPLAIINPLKHVEWTVEALFYTATTILNRSVDGQPEPWGEFSPGMEQFAAIVRSEGLRLGSTEADRRMRELITQLFNNGGIFNENNNAPFRVVVADVTEFLGFGRMPYLDTGYVNQYIKPHLVHSFVGIICVGCIAIFMFMGAYIFARRIFEILLLYIVSPYFAATIPLDGGQKFKAWREQFIGKMLAGFGIVFSMRIFLLMVPVIFSPNVRFTWLPIVDTLIRMLLLIAAAASVIKAHKLIGKIVGGESAAESEASGLGGKAVSLALSPVTNVAGAVHRSATQTFNRGMQKTLATVHQGAVTMGAGMVRGGVTAITSMRSSRGNSAPIISKRGSALEKLDPGGGVKHGKRPNFTTDTLQKPPPTTEPHSSIPLTATKPNVYISPSGGQQVSKNNDTSSNVKVGGSPSGTVPDQKTNSSYQSEQLKQKSNSSDKPEQSKQKSNSNYQPEQLKQKSNNSDQPEQSKPNIDSNYQPEQSKRQVIYKDEAKPKSESVPSSDAPNRLNEHLSQQKNKQISRRDSKD